MSDSSSSSDSDLFPDAVYTEAAPIKPEIAEIGSKPMSEVLSELEKEVSKERTQRKTAQVERVTIADKLNAIKAEQLEEDRQRGRKQPRGKDEVPAQQFKRPKVMSKGPF